MFSDGRVSFFVSDVHHLNGYFLLICLVSTPEEVGAFGEIEMVIKTIRIVLDFLP
jgi:hypothetical protein